MGVLVTSGRLEGGLSGAMSAAEACQHVADLLAELDLLASAYLWQGERLRCLGVRGYWQIYDGMPGTGVIGRVSRTGERLFLRGVESSEDYLQAAPAIRDELCVPLRVQGRVVGVLNVESTSSISAQQERATDCAAAALENRLAGLPATLETAGQVLGRHAARLSTLAATVDGAELHDAVLEAAVELSGLSSAVLCLPGSGRLAVRATSGPLSRAYRALPTAELEHIAAWVATGTSSYTVGASEGIGFPGHELLRTQGTATLAVLPLRAGGGGMLLLAGKERVHLASGVVVQLELLAAVVDASLVVAEAVRALRRRADTDPLTGLGHHASFHAAVGPARRTTAGQALAVLYIDIDHFKAVNDRCGHAAGDALLVRIADTMRAVLHGRDRLFRIGGDEFAVLSSVDDPAAAVTLGERLRAEVSIAGTATLSIGVAVATPGESDTALLARADAAVYSAKAEGRDRVVTDRAGRRETRVRGTS